MISNLFTFAKEERLCGELRIDELFSRGQAFTVFPLRVVFLPKERSDDTPAKVLISVPKKRLRRANKRNTVKRRLREAYRLNKPLLYDRLTLTENALDVAFIYLANEVLDYAFLARKVAEALEALAKKTNEKPV